jgi:diacylglycerol kinase (ATP)
MKDYYFIVNPVSRGGHNKKYIELLRRWIPTKFPKAVLAVTKRPGHASQLAGQAAQQGFQRVVAVGGDGTLHEVVNGLASLPAASQPAVGILSAGTGGDFVRSLHDEFSFPKDFSWLEGPKEIPMDIGKATLEKEDGATFEKFFINIADLGLSGEVSQRVNVSEKILGTWEYLYSSLVAALRYQAPRVRISGISEAGKEQDYEVELLLLVVANGKYFGGGMCIAPQAKMDDQKFEILLAEKVGYLTLLREIPHLYLKEKIRHPKVHYGVGRKIRVQCLKGRLAVDLDGEYFSAQRVCLELIPKGIKILVPNR